MSAFGSRAACSGRSLFVFNNCFKTFRSLGYRTLGQDSGTLKLDAKSSTVDPDNTGDDLSCSWVCKDMSNQQPCYSAVNKQNKIALPNECVITVASTEFAAGKSYEIT